MNLTLAISEDLQTSIEAQVNAGAYPSATEYFLDLVLQDQKQKQAQAQLELLLQEGLDSEAELVTPAYWEHLHTSVLVGR